MHCYAHFDENKLAYFFMTYKLSEGGQNLKQSKFFVLEKYLSEILTSGLDTPEWCNPFYCNSINEHALKKFIIDIAEKQQKGWTLNAHDENTASFMSELGLKNPKIKEYNPKSDEIYLSRLDFFAKVYDFRAIDDLRSIFSAKLTNKSSNAASMNEVIESLSQCKMVFPLYEAKASSQSELLICSRFSQTGSEWPKVSKSNLYPLLQISKKSLKKISGQAMIEDYLQLLCKKNEATQPVERRINYSGEVVPTQVAKTLAKIYEKYEWCSYSERDGDGKAYSGFYPITIIANLDLSEHLKLRNLLSKEEAIVFDKAFSLLGSSSRYEDYSAYVEPDLHMESKFKMFLIGDQLSLLSDKDNISIELIFEEGQQPRANELNRWHPN